MSLVAYRQEEIAARKERVERFKRLAVQSNMNVQESDLSDLNDTREVLVKQADSRAMTSSGTWISTEATNLFALVLNEDRVMDAGSQQKDRPIVVLAAGFHVNGAILTHAAMLKIRRLGRAVFKNMGQDYPDFETGLEELIFENIRQPSILSVDSDLTAGSGELAYSFEHVKRTDLFPLAKPLYVGRGASPMIEIQGLGGQTSMGSELSLQLKLLALQPVK